MGPATPDTSIVPQNRSALAVHVDSGSLISIFLNAAAGKITASSFGRTTTGGSFKATATGILSNGQIPKLTNNGSIKAFASAESGTIVDATAQAYAHGLILNPPAGANVLSAVTNNGSINATAFAKASAETDAGATASATAASQVATGTGAGSKVTLSLTNASTGVIGAKATAVASATYHAAVRACLCERRLSKRGRRDDRDAFAGECRDDIGGCECDGEAAFRHLCRGERDGDWGRPARRGPFGRHGQPDAYQLEDRRDQCQGDGARIGDLQFRRGPCICRRR